VGLLSARESSQSRNPQLHQNRSFCTTSTRQDMNLVARSYPCLSEWPLVAAAVVLLRYVESRWDSTHFGERLSEGGPYNLLNCNVP
jgi:hypothetical protein